MAESDETGRAARNVPTGWTHLSDEQRARAGALHVAREMVMSRSGGPFSSTTRVGDQNGSRVYELLSLADYVITGNHRLDPEPEPSAPAPVRIDLDSQRGGDE